MTTPYLKQNVFEFILDMQSLFEEQKLEEEAKLEVLYFL